MEDAARPHSIGKPKIKSRPRSRLTILKWNRHILTGFLLALCLGANSCTPVLQEEPTTVPSQPTITSVQQNNRQVIGGPYQHKILSASSTDGINWSLDRGVRLEHASVPCAIADGNRILLYYVDADRGPGLPESIACAISTDGINFIKQPFDIKGMTTRKALDPAVMRTPSSQFRLYYLASNASGDPGKDLEPHQIHLALSDDGINFGYDKPVFTYPGLVDPDVFVLNDRWFMYVPSKGSTIIATSTDGREFTYLQQLYLNNWATEAPIKLEDGSLRMYAFQEGKPTGNAVHSFRSNNGIDWIEEPSDRLVAADGEKITSPSVVRWGNGYKMFYKIETPTGINNPPPQRQTLPAPGTAGPWDQDVNVFQVNTIGTVTKTAVFERAGVPTVTRLKDGRLIAAHQFFPANDPENFDKVAVRFSLDEGYSWTSPQVINLFGLPAGMRFPFDPTLVTLTDGKIRLYFTSLHGRQFNEDVPAIFSAISLNGIDYVFEPGTRFNIQGRPVIDCAVVLHQGVFHLFSPDNGNQMDQKTNQIGPQGMTLPYNSAGYHATSPDGLNFTRVDDVNIDSSHRWLGNAQSDGKVITFWGTLNKTSPSITVNTPPIGGLWAANSTDGKEWQLIELPLIAGADPGAVVSLKNGWIVATTGPPRPGTPSQPRTRNEQIPMGPGQPVPPVSRGDGPWNHRVLLAVSGDGQTWQISEELVIEQASVPELYLSPDGHPILLFVDASGKTKPGELGVMVRQDDNTWLRKQTNLQGADPNVILLKVGGFRAYTKEKDGSILVSSSQNGLDWQLLGTAFKDERYTQATDPDVFETASGWIMLVSLGPRLLRCTSEDGLKFKAGEVIDLGGSVSDTVKVPNGWRTFFHVNPNPQTGEKMIIRSAFSADGLGWRIEEGIRVPVPVMGPAQLGVADPGALLLDNGTWLMAVKSFIK